LYLNGGEENKEYLMLRFNFQPQYLPTIPR